MHHAPRERIQTRIVVQYHVPVGTYEFRVFSSPSQLPFRVASPVIELIYYPINFPYYFVRTLENDYLF